MVTTQTGILPGCGRESEVDLEVRDVAPGVYALRMGAGRSVATRRVVVLR